MELMQDNEKGLKQELVADSLDYENFDFDAMEEAFHLQISQKKQTNTIMKFVKQLKQWKKLV